MKRAIPALVLLLLLLLGLDVKRRLSIDSSMEHFLPGGEEKELYRVSRKVVESSLTGRMIFSLQYDAPPNDPTPPPSQRDQLLRAANQLAADFRKLHGVTAVEAGPPSGINEAFYELYFPRRFSFFSLEPERDAPLRFNDARLTQDASKLKARLAGPEGILIRELATRDPWLLFPEFLEKAQADASALSVYEGQFFSRSGEAIVFVELRDSALDASLQTPLLTEMRAAVERLHKEVSANIRVESSGANRFAVDTERKMRRDTEQVFGFSLVGLLLLFILLFRTPTQLLFLLLPLGCGLVLASWVTLLLYGRLHGLTLGFGGALLGVGLDYPVHLLCHHGLRERRRATLSSQPSPYVSRSSGAPARETLRDILPSLLLAAGTTLLGLVGLGFASFPGIRELAVFTATGICGALLGTIGLVGLLPPSGKGTMPARRAADLLARLYGVILRKRQVSWALLAAATLLGIVGLSRARYAKELDSLAPLDAGLMAEDGRVRARVGEADGGKLVVSLGSDLEQALRTSEVVELSLRDAKKAGEIDGFLSVSPLLRSKRLQERASLAVRSQKSVKERTLTALARAGFVPGAFSVLGEELERHVAPLTTETLRGTPLEPLVNNFVLNDDGESAVITSLQQVRDEPKLKERLAQIENAHYFSSREMLSSAYRDLRTRTGLLLSCGFLLVFLVSLLRYRKIRLVGVALLPAALATAATLGVLSLGGVELNLLHLLGLILVFSMGVDYGVFLVDAEADDIGVPLLSITVGCASTLLSFGVLAFSSTPALSALGSSIAIGILLSLLFAPAALVLNSAKDPL